MCENSVICDQMVPSFVGQYRRKPDERIPEIVVIDIDSNLSKQEKRVCDFFKCTKDWISNKDNQLIGPNSSLDRLTDTDHTKKCFATRHTTLAFQTHLKEKHLTDELFCAYCWDLKDSRYSSLSVLKTYPHRYLIKHIMKRHRFRRFQCNFCLYRAITEDHLIIHQKMNHEKEYFNTTIGHSVTKSDEICKIFVCPKNIEEVKSLYYYWRKFNAQRFNCNGNNETLYQCLYCSFMNDLLVKVIQHIVQRHPDYPLLYYIPEPQISSSTNNRLVSDWNSYELIANFRPKRPKIEPQDNSISSTQRSPENSLQTIAEQNINSIKRSLDSEEAQSGSKRPRIDSTQSNSDVDQNVVQTVESLTVQKYIICLFCKKKFIGTDSKAFKDSKSHLESHLKLNSIKEGNVLQFINNWIQTFVSNQWKLCSFIDFVELDPLRAHYSCPLCVRLAKLHNRIPENYKTFSEVRYHLWQHCCWLSVKCKHCFSSIPNIDPIISKHFRQNHISMLKNKYEFLFDPNRDIPFTVEQKELLQKKFIEVTYNRKIDKSINKLLVETKEQFEQNWRDIKQNELKAKYEVFKDMLPEVSLNRLSGRRLDKYMGEYRDYEMKKIQKSAMSELDKSAAIHMLFDAKCDQQKHKKKNKKDKHLKEKDSKKKSKKNSLNGSQHSLGTSGQSCSGVSLPQQNTRELFHPSVDTEPDLDKELEEEESHRIICYHCNERFKKMKDYKNHSKEKHPNQVLRMYSKRRKSQKSK